MPALLVSHHRPGFYLRVLEEGDVGAGDEIIKVADRPERVTVADIDALLYLPGHSREQLESSLRIPALSPGWKSSLQALLDQSGSEAGKSWPDGIRRASTRLARLSATPRYEGGTGEFQRNLVVLRTTGCFSSPRGSAWAVSRLSAPRQA